VLCLGGGSALLTRQDLLIPALCAVIPVVTLYLTISGRKRCVIFAREKHDL
jgi:hypothetical protein